MSEEFNSTRRSLLTATALLGIRTGELSGTVGAARRSLDGASITNDLLQRSTGPVARNVHENLSEFVSVLDFGAKGDGVTDDTFALQAALDASPCVHFPRGTYRHKRLILRFHDQILRGDGQGSSILYCPSGYAITNYAGGDADPIGPDWVGGPTLEYLTLRGGFHHTEKFAAPNNSWAFSTGRTKRFTQSAINSGLRLKRCYPYLLQNISIEHFHRGVFVSGSALGRWNNFDVSNCEYGMFGESGESWGDSAWKVTTHHWQDGRFRNCWIGIGGEDFCQCQIYKKSVDFEPCNTGISITNGADNVWSGYFELCSEGIYRNGNFMGADIIEDPFFGGTPGALWGIGNSIMLDHGIGANGVVTLRDGHGTLGGGGISVLGGRFVHSGRHRGALLLLSPSFTPDSHQSADVAWSAGPGAQNLGVLDPKRPTEIIIPKAWNGSLIKLRASIFIKGDHWENTVSGDIRKNGQPFPGTGGFSSTFKFANVMHVETAPIRVKTGDYFSLSVRMTLPREISGGDLSWVSIEIIE